jgi:hypothetical protein
MYFLFVLKKLVVAEERGGKGQKSKIASVVQQIMTIFASASDLVPGDREKEGIQKTNTILVSFL